VIRLVQVRQGGVSLAASQNFAIPSIEVFSQSARDGATVDGRVARSFLNADFLYDANHIWRKLAKKILDSHSPCYFRSMPSALRVSVPDSDLIGALR